MDKIALGLLIGLSSALTIKLLTNWNFGRQPMQIYVTADDEETPLLEPEGYVDEWAVLWSDGSLELVQIEEDGEE